MNVSVVIPTYNRATVIGEALNSVMSQTYRNFEILVVDDGSMDDTAERVERFVQEGHVRLIRQANAGASAARNAGIRLCKGEIISFLDSDDLWKPEKLSLEVEFLTLHPEIDAIFSDLEKYDGKEFTPSFMRSTEVFSRLLADHRSADGMALSQRQMLLCLLQEIPIKPSTLTIRRAMFTRIGYFLTSWRSSEDWEFLLRLAHVGRFGYLDRPLGALRVRGDALHRADAEGGLARMRHRLVEEKDRLAKDPEGMVAVRRGISNLSTHLGWHYLECKRKGAALKTYVTGFFQSRDLELMLRALSLCLPEAIRLPIIGMVKCRQARGDPAPTQGRDEMCRRRV